MEVLINLSKDQEADLRLLDIEKDGHNWKEAELRTKLILRVDLKADDAKELLSGKSVRGKKKDKGGIGEEVTNRRKVVVNQRALNLTQGQWANLRNQALSIHPFRDRIFDRSIFIEVR